ncbi:MAG: serine/threonine-protein kinase [Pirellula sp.]
MPIRNTNTDRTEAFERDVDSKLAAALNEYQRAVDSGTPIALDDLLTRYPDIEKQLMDCLTAMQYVNAAVSPNINRQTVVPTLVPGSVIGDFRVVREIGRGGMGVVYEARQCSVKRSVALKVLPSFGAEHTRAVQRFHNEVQAIGMLQHPHIVPVYAVGQTEGVHYYAMQLISGKSLSDLLDHAMGSQEPVGFSTDSQRQKETDVFTKDQDPDSKHPVYKAVDSLDSDEESELLRKISLPKEVAQMILDAADALQHAHDSGIVHRDIKPSNLLLDKKGELWVADFGLAKLPGSELTATNDLLGTLRYMSPEQIAGRTVDGRTDVYSLGVTLYELITGVPAFDAEDRRALLRKVMEEEPMLPRRRRNCIPPDLETVCRKSMAKDPNERYQTAGEFRDDLERFLYDKPIVARRATWIEQSIRWSRRYPLVAGLLAALLIAVSGLAFLSSTLVRTNSDLQVAVDRADDARRQLFKALDSVISGGAEDHLSGQKEISPRQRQFYETIVKQFQLLADTAPRDDNTQIEVAAALTALGGLKSRIGDLNEAEDILQDAITRQRSILQRRPTHLEVVTGLAKSYWNLGNALEEKDEWEKATEAFETTIDLLVPILQDHPDMLGDHRVLASAQVSLGINKQAYGDVEMGMDSFQAGLRTLETILSQVPKDAWALYSKADCLHLIGRVFAYRGEASKAKLSYDQGLEAIAPLVANSEAELHFRTIAAKLHISRAMAMREIDSGRSAGDELAVGINGLQNILTQSVGNHSVRRQLGLALLHAGQWSHRDGDLDHAIQRFHEAEEAFLKLVADQPDRPNHQHNLAWLYEERSRVLTELNRHDSARQDMLESLRIWKPLSAQYQSKNPWYFLGVSDTLANLLQLPPEQCVYCTAEQREAASAEVVEYLQRAYAAGWRPSARTRQEYSSANKWEAFRTRKDFASYLALIEELADEADRKTSQDERIIK